MRFFYVSVRHFCCSAETNDDGIIIEAAPIMKGWLRKNIRDVYNYYKRKRSLLMIKEQTPNGDWVEFK